MIRVAVNGFGRIGRSFLRAYLADLQAQSIFKIVAINMGPANKEWAAHLFKYDSFMGTWSEQVEYEDGCLRFGKIDIPLLTTIDPLDINWGELEVDWVVDATGRFTQKEEAQKHMQSGAKNVLITAFAENPDVTIVMGVNHESYDRNIHKIVSLASCTANCLYPVVKVLHEAFDLKAVIMNTMHSYTNRQVLMDIESVNLRRSRGAAVNIIPTTLQCPDRIREVYPQFTGRISGQSTRVPIGKVSFLDVAFTTDVALHREDINDVLVKARDLEMKGILGTSTEPLVSSDYINNAYSVTVDESLTVATDSLYKIFAWYDNEAGYSHRIKDFLISTVQ